MGACNNTAPASAPHEAAGRKQLVSSPAAACPPKAKAVAGSAGAAPLVCPFACLGCSVGFSQLQRLIDHVNGHRDGLGADLWAEVVMQAGPDALGASWGACGLLVPNTAHGRSKHLDACAACSEEVAGAVRREQGGNDSAFGALGGLTTQSLGAAVAYSDVTVGALRLTARDCGWLADTHSNVCFYMSCADGSTGDALALKQRLAGHAKVLALARRHALNAHLPVPDYAAPNCKADELVFLAFALLEGPLCVVDTVASAGSAILYTSPAKRAGSVTFVLSLPEHFQRLDGPDTTVDQLLAAAQQADPARPAAGLAPGKGGAGSLLMIKRA